MLKRKVTDTLLRWKHTKSNQGLLITGARQVGKTSIVELFAAEHYENMVKIDFIETPAAIELISGAQNIDDLIVRITALADRPLPDGKTLLFFDEIQRCSDTLTWMRYLADDGRFDVVYSGSLLGIEAYDFRSLPVGTIDIAEMFPLDFQEFCWANGVNDSLWSIVEECHRERTEVPRFLHDRLNDLFTRYILVGGMPEAVQVFVTTSDTQAMRARQRSIVDAYRADVTRYVKDRTHAQRIKTIYHAIPAQLNKENRRFIISGIDKKKRFEDMQSDFDWLVNAGVAIPVKRVSEITYPLGMNREDSFFKFYMNDVGLLFSCFSDTDVQSIIMHDDKINFGQAFENAVAQELRAHKHESLYYFNTNKIGEVDFLLESNATIAITPLEVKSGKYSTRHAALDNLLKVKNYDFAEALVLHRANLKKQGAITYLPIYMVSFL